MNETVPMPLDVMIKPMSCAKQSLPRHGIHLAFWDSSMPLFIIIAAFHHEIKLPRSLPSSKLMIAFLQTTRAMAGRVCRLVC